MLKRFCRQPPDARVTVPFVSPKEGGMRRREFLTLAGGLAASWPLTARAQQPAMPVIGFFGTGTPSGWRRWTSAFVSRLRELDWIEDRTVGIEYRRAKGEMTAMLKSPQNWSDSRS